MVTFFIVLFIIQFCLFFLLIRAMVCGTVNENMVDMAIKDIPDYNWYVEWDVRDWIINPLRYNLWTAKSTRKYLQGK